MIESYAACAAYVLPVVVMFVVRARRDRPLWQLALDAPVAIAADLILVLSLSRLFILSTSTLLVRGIWLVALIGVFVYRRRKRQSLFEWPAELEWQCVTTCALAAVFALLLSMELSRACIYTDRSWHIPLVSSIGGQKLPFENVYEPGVPLPYHFAGDVVPAMLRALSGAVIHSNTALSLAHDVVFGLYGWTCALLLWALGLRYIVPTAIASLAPLLFGPAVTFVYDRRQGHNFLDIYRLSFRPHTVVAAFMVLGLAGAVLARLHLSKRKLSWRATAAPFWCSTAVLAVSDEATIAQLGLVLGLVWLAYPEVVGERRSRGFLVLLGMLIALVGASALFHGTLLTGVGEDAVSWVSTRVPGYKRTPLPLEEGMEKLEWDLWPFVVLWLAGLTTFLRRRLRAFGASFSFATVLFMLGVVLLLHIDIGDRSVESHRFMTAPMLVMPLFALAWIIRSAKLRTRTGPSIGLSTSLVVVSLVWASVSSLEWLRATTKEGSRYCDLPSAVYSKWDFYDVDCRAWTGARVSDKARVVYLERSIAYVYAGCRPTYASAPIMRDVKSDRIDIDVEGKKVPIWTTPIGKINVGSSQFRQILGNHLPRTEDLVLVCHPNTGDKACRTARRYYRCTKVGREIMHCRVPAAQKRSFTRRYRRPSR